MRRLLTFCLNERDKNRSLSSLKEVVRENCLSVSSDVKKLKIQKDFVWKYEGNKTQYMFNADFRRQSETNSLGFRININLSTHRSASVRWRIN